MPNDVLRRALADARLTEQQLAERIGANPLTVSRWITEPDRVPQQRLRWAAAEALGVDEMELWPSAVRSAVKTGPDRELVAIYPTIAAVPREIWQRLVGGATRDLAVCFSAPHWLEREVPDLVGTLRRLVDAGTRVRLVLTDPDADRPADGLPLPLANRLDATRHLLEPLRDAVEVRQSAYGYGRSVLRSDDDALVNWWVHRKAANDPYLHLHRRQDGGMFDQVLLHIEELWNDAVPVWPETGTG